MACVALFLLYNTQRELSLLPWTVTTILLFQRGIQTRQDGDMVGLGLSRNCLPYFRLVWNSRDRGRDQNRTLDLILIDWMATSSEEDGWGEGLSEMAWSSSVLLRGVEGIGRGGGQGSSLLHKDNTQRLPTSCTCD